MRALALVLLCSACSAETPVSRSTQVDARELARVGDDPAIHFVREEDRFVVRGLDRVPLVHPAGAELLQASLPLRADGVVVLSRPSSRLGLRMVGARPVEGSIEGDAIVYRRAWPSVDLVLAARGGAIEDLRVVHDASGLAWLATELSEDALVENGSIFAQGFRADSPRAWDANGRDVPVRVTIENRVLRLQVDAHSFPIVVDPAWMASAALATPRDKHAGAPIAGGKVIAIGGTSGAGSLSTTEIYDPASASWSAGPSLAHARRSHRALVVDAGVLVVGGEGVSIAELYDGATWSDVGVGSVRANAAASAITGGALVTGGHDVGTLSTAEVWSATSKSFHAVPAMSVPREEHVAVTLGDGRVLVAGGRNGTTSLSSAEIFDPASETWTVVASMNARRHAPSAHLLADGSVLVVGGLLDAAESGFDDSERFVPSTGTWTRTPNAMNRDRGRFGNVTLDKGRRVMVAGGYDEGTYRGVSNMFDLASLTWLAPDDLGSGLSEGGHQRTVAVPLGDFSALFFGGAQPGGPSRTTDVFALRKDGEKCTPIAGGDRVCEHACMDLFCCDTPCLGACESCAVKGKEGTCTPISGTPVPPRACEGGYATCDAGKCRTTCSKDEECKSSFFCDGGACNKRKSLGSGCSGSSQCESRICSDGHCCEAACVNTCEACDEHGACVPVAAGSKPPRDENGCGGFVCGGVSCKTKCASDEDCISKYRCVAGTCSPRQPNECTLDRLSSIDTATGVTTSCLAYRCDPSGKCITSCGGSGDCAPGHTCDLESKQCLPSEEPRTGGCSASRSADARWTWMLALLLLRRRR